jgi:hypothetical protein
MKTIKTLIFDIFYLLIGAYIALMFLEYFKPGLVSNYFNLNKILYFLAPIGVLCVLIGNKKTKSELPEQSDLSDQIK